MKRSAAVVTRRRRQSTASRFMVKCQLFRRATELGLWGFVPFLFVRIGGTSAARFPSKRKHSQARKQASLEGSFDGQS